MKKYIGVDVGGTTVKAALVDENGKILRRSSIPTLATRKSDELIADIIAQIKELAANDVYEGVGVGCPGTVDSETGDVMYSCNLYWENVPLVKKLCKALNKPVKACNDASAAALGEARFGAGKGCSDTAFITLGTGVGGGIVVNGKLFDGYRGMGTEIGHMVIRYGGVPCTCGRNGCLEAYCLATALIRDTVFAMQTDRNSAMWKFVDGDLNKVDGRTSFECAKKGDATALRVVNKFLDYLAEGITDIVNVFRSQAVIIGGGVSAQEKYITEPLQERVDRLSYGVGNSGVRTEIVTASLGNDAGVIGAASLVM